MEPVPFYANTADDTHCVQAAFRSMLKYFLPEREFSWDELDRLTHKIEGKGTWWFAALPKLSQMGLQVRLIEAFDYQKFFEQGERYVREVYEPEIADWYLKNTNLVQVRQFVPEFAATVNWQKRPANLEDLDGLIKSGWLVGIDLNARMLNKRAGYSSHMVVVFGKQNDHYVLHDPGLPPHKNRQVGVRELLAAWSYAGRKNMTLVALKASKK